MSIREELVALTRERMCRVERTCGKGDSEDGYVLAVGEEYFAMEKFDGFTSNGVSIFRIDQVIRAFTTDDDELFERAIEAEGLRCILPPFTALASLQALLVWAHRQDELVIAEVESDVEEDSDYWLGRITHLDEKEAKLVELDIQGHWEPDVETISIGEVTHLQVGTPYCAMFAKYCDPWSR